MLQNDTEAPMMCSMSDMTFHFGNSLKLLFSQWQINTPGELVGAAFAVFFIAVLYEGLKTLREYLVFLDLLHTRKTKKKEKEEMKEKEKEEEEEEEGGGKGSNDYLIPATGKRARRFKYYTISFSMHLLQTALHVVQVGVGYLLMLVAMTYNGWLFLAIILGAGTGYFAFARSRHILGNFREKNEHCG